jgi:6-phosphogluconolactonase (cycloisomerase 2 family)
LKLPPGSGPRHLAFDTEGRHAYVLCELSPVLYVCSVDSETGELRITQELEAADPQSGDTAAPAAVKLHPSGKTLAVSSRFDDRISVFSINREGAGSEFRGNAVLSLVDRFSCRGKTPRDITFSPDGSLLFIANQDSHNISCRNFNPSSGLPGYGWAEEVSTGSPVCIVML